MNTFQTSERHYLIGLNTAASANAAERRVGSAVPVRRNHRYAGTQSRIDDEIGDCASFFATERHEDIPPTD